MRRFAIFGLLLALTDPAYLLAGPAVSGAVEKQGMNVTAIVMFVAFVGRDPGHHLLGVPAYPHGVVTSTPPAAASPASRTAWPSPATTCPRPPSWVSRAWCSPPATTA